MGFCHADVSQNSLHSTSALQSIISQPKESIQVNLHQLMHAAYFFAIGHLTFVCLDTKPLSGSEAEVLVDLVFIQTILLLICKSFSCYANYTN